MKKTFLLIMLLMAFQFESSAQTKQLFDFGWQFTHNGKTQTVNLPHDWDIFEGPNSGKGATGTGGGWFEAGKGEYKKEFRVESLELRDKLVKLHFEGVYQKAEVFVNGQKAGQHHYGYTPFTVDVTKFLYKDKRENEVIVKVDNSEQPNCRWYSGSGIYRHVWLETMPAFHIAENGIFVTTPEVSADKAKVQVEVTVQNESDNNQKGIVVVEGKHQEVSLKAGESKAVTFTYDINNPKLWSPDSPYLYTAKATIVAPSGAEGGASTPEYRLLQKQVEAAKLQKKLAVGENMPSVAVGAGYNYHNLMEKDHSFAMVFATVSVPISDWWGGSHAIRRKKIEQQKAEEQLADNSELLKIRIQNAWNNVQEAYQQLQLAQRNI